MVDITDIESGDELALEITAEVEQWEDGEMTVPAQRIDEDQRKVYLHDEDGSEFGYITICKGELLDEDAQIRLCSGVLLARVDELALADEDEDQENEEGSNDQDGEGLMTDGGNPDEDEDDAPL
jgi:hypothetical protein